MVGWKWTATVAFLLMTVTATTALAQTAPVGTATGSLGTILVDQNGMTLYTLSSDSFGVSTCSAACLGPWPAAIVDADATAMIQSGGAASMPALGSMARADGGGVELTWNGMPLYRFARDAAPGDVNGNGINAFGGTWMVVQP